MTIRLTLALFLAIVLASCLPSVAPNLGDGTGRGYLGYLDGAAVFSIFAGASEATLVITGENLVVDDPRCVAVPHVVEAYSCRIGQVLPARLERVVFDGQEVILWLAWCDGPRCYRLVADFRPVQLRDVVARVPGLLSPAVSGIVCDCHLLCFSDGVEQ